MSPAIKPSKAKLQPWMSQSLEKLHGKAELKTLLQKFFGYIVNDEQMPIESPFASAIEGPHQKTTVGELKAKLESVGKSSGQAVVITALDLGHFALDTYDLFPEQLHDYAKFHSGWRYTLANTTQENVASTWLGLREITVLTESSTVDDSLGLLKAASHPLQHWALIWQYVHTIETTSDKDSVALQVIRKSLKHYPVTFEFMKVGPDLQVKLFQRSFQLMENVNIDQEAQAMTGWEILKTWDRARSLSRTHYDDGTPDGVDALMGSITFAESSEYKIKSSNKKAKGTTSSKDDKSARMLMAYDKIKEANAEWVFETAKKNKFGRRSPLVSVTKIVEITKKGSSSSACLGFLFETMLVRCARNIMEENCSSTQLNKVLPVCKGIYEMIVACKNFFVYDSGSFEEGLIQGTLQKPWAWHTLFKDTKHRSEHVMPHNRKRCFIVGINKYLLERIAWVILS